MKLNFFIIILIIVFSYYIIKDIIIPLIQLLWELIRDGTKGTVHLTEEAVEYAVNYPEKRRSKKIFNKIQIPDLLKEIDKLDLDIQLKQLLKDVLTKYNDEKHYAKIDAYYKLRNLYDCIEKLNLKDTYKNVLYNFLIKHYTVRNRDSIQNDYQILKTWCFNFNNLITIPENEEKAYRFLLRETSNLIPSGELFNRHVTEKFNKFIDEEKIKSDTDKFNNNVKPLNMQKECEELLKEFIEKYGDSSESFNALKRACENIDQTSDVYKRDLKVKYVHSQFELIDKNPEKFEEKFKEILETNPHLQ